MEKRETAHSARGLTDLLRRRRQNGQRAGCKRQCFDVCFHASYYSTTLEQ